MPKWIPWVLVLAACGLLALRLLGLDTRVQAMRSRVAALGEAGDLERDVGGDADASVHEEGRVAAMTRELQRLREDLKSLQQANAGNPTRADLDEAVGKGKILSVVEERDQRVLDKQLEFHRARWIDGRQAAVRNFSASAKLDPDQTAALTELLAREVDGMIDVLRRPGVLEDPRPAADEWTALLDETDNAAEDVLDPAQHSEWTRVRAHERRAYRRWLGQLEPPK